MKILLAKKRVKCFHDRFWQQGVQELRVYYYLFGLIPIWYRVLEREFVPSHVFISDACFGDTGGWTSKFAPFAPGGWVIENKNKFKQKGKAVWVMQGWRGRQVVHVEDHVDGPNKIPQKLKDAACIESWLNRNVLIERSIDGDRFVTVFNWPARKL